MAEQTNLSAGWAPRFFTIWTGQALSLLGSNIAQFALVWWVTKTTGSATVLATATLVALLPQVFLGPMVGALVDRWDRRKVMIVADSGIALVSMILVYLFWADRLAIWHIYVIMLARGLGGTFHSPAMQASTSLMVPEEHLPRVAGANQTLMGALNVVGPPLGAFLMEIMALYSIMAIDVVTALFAIVPLFFITIPNPPKKAVQKGLASLWADIREGLVYIWNWPGALLLCVLAMILNFFISPAMRLMPMLVKEHFQGGALELGWLQSAWGLGLVMGGVLLSVWGGFKRRIVTALLGIAGLGVGALIVGLVPSDGLLIAVGALFFGAVMNALCNGSLMALVQTVTPPEMQGRFFTVLGSLTAAMIPLGMAIGGPVADAWGTRVLFVVAGVMQIAVGLGGFLMPVLMRLEDHHRDTGVVEEPVMAAG